MLELVKLKELGFAEQSVFLNNPKRQVSLLPTFYGERGVKLPLERLSNLPTSQTEW